MGLSPRAKSVSTVMAATPSPCPCSDEILRNGQPITDANRNVLPGEWISLEIHCDSYTLTEITWTISEKSFTDYVPTNNTGTLTALQNSDLHGKTIGFFWADHADGKTVEVNFKANGIACKKSAILNVKKVDSSVVVTIGIVTFGTIVLPTGSIPGVGLFKPNGTTSGIYFAGSVTVPSGFTKGSWEFTQRVNPAYAIDKDDATQPKCHAQDLIGSFFLDNVYPYDGPWDTGTNHTTNDTPSDGLPGRSETRRSDHFEMFVMFKPSGNDSKWVPLRMIAWHCEWCATKLSPGWSLITKDKDVDSNAETSDHPVWTKNVANSTFPEVTCPPPCSP